ncbi:MAG TPA: hybrid sensor histidine kinase/response regulator, partial [Erythrobacter sp.]|nr:hybrid sensor histidine kinase/response regulator [Erythrobacter sp.]
DLASPSDRERLELIHSAARNGAELTSRLLSFARQQPLAPQRIDIAEQMAQAARLIRHALPDQVELTVDVEGQTLYAEVDPSQLDNALVNLALNARDAMPQGGSLSLEARPYRVEAGLLDSVLEPGDYIRIAMVDTGAGIAPEIAPRVFEPFFTTKPIGDGTGLGLSMVYGFAKQSGGYALVESSPGKGTTVSIFLPQAAGGRPVPRSNDASPRMGRQNATILLVEDDTQVRDYVEWILNAEGYSVLSASDGREALEILEQHTEIRLMCTDVVMPGRMDGIELTREAQRRLPGLKVLVISGYASEASLREALDWSDTAWLPKPFTRRDLAGALAQMERS